MLEPKVAKTGTCPLHEIDSLPQETGVYLFVSSRGTILYVGKAKRLRTRVATYFTDRVHHPRLTRLRRDAAEVHFMVTASELDALLLEDDLIKLHNPSFNRAQKDHHRSVYVRLSRKEPHLSLSIEPAQDALYYGPFKDPWKMKDGLDLISDYVGFRQSLAYQDIADSLSFSEKFELARAILEATDSTLLRRLVKRRDIQARLLQFEAAARTQEKIKIVIGLQRWVKLLRAINRPVDKSEIDRLIILSRHLASS